MTAPERSDWVPTRQAAELVGINPRTMRNRIVTWGLPTRRDPADLRVRLIDRRELERYLKGETMAT